MCKTDKSGDIGFCLIILFAILIFTMSGCAPDVNFMEKPAASFALKNSPIPANDTIVPTAISPEMSLMPTTVFTPTSTAVSLDITATEHPVKTSEKLTITIVFDNIDFDQRLKTSWGFSALVEYHDHTLLFDTGGDGRILTENMRILGIDPTKVQSVVLSHAHGDHTGGLLTLLETGIQPVVYLLPSFPAAFKEQIKQYTTVVEVSPGQFIAEGILTTGEMGQGIPEQALIIQHEQGSVIITGCAHPGIVEIVEQTVSISDEPVQLVLGGFHLGDKSFDEINGIVADFKRLGVEQVAPSHCTGGSAISIFDAGYGMDFIRAGAGKVIVLLGEND